MRSNKKAKFLTFFFLFFIMSVSSISQDIQPIIYLGNESISFNVDIQPIMKLNPKNIGPIYGEMWNYTKAGKPYLFVISQAGIYYNLTDLRAGDLNGFIFENNTQLNGGSNLIAQVSGLYSVSFSISFNGANAGGLYGFSVSHNHEPDNHRECYARRTAKTDVGNVGINCIIDLDVGDIVSIGIENELADKNIVVHTVNLNLVRIGP